MGWVRAHLWEDRSRVEGGGDRRAVVRVVPGQPARLCLPSNCPWFHLSPSDLPPGRSTLRRQEVGGPRELAGEGVKALEDGTLGGSRAFPLGPPQNCTGQRASRRRA